MKVTALILCAVATVNAQRGGQSGRGGRGGGMQPCAYSDSASLQAALTGFGCDTSADDCSAKCAENLLPLMRECMTLMQPYMQLGMACRQTERGESHDRTDDPNTETRAECHDGVDNDGDGDADCEDSDCARFGCRGRGDRGNTNPFDGRGGRGSSGGAGCDTATLYGAFLECGQWSTMALADGVIDESDGFCDSSCYSQLSPIHDDCSNRMTSQMTQAFSPLAPLLGECAAALTQGGRGGRGRTCNARMVQMACGDPAAAAVTCNERCIRALDTGKANCASDPTFATYAAVPSACAQDTANAQCDATAQSFLTFVDQSCCRDEDCSGLPKECTEECANTYMPFFSRCGRHVFGDDQTNLAKFEAFERKCAQSLGRQVDTSEAGAMMRGPDRRDPCSQTSECTECSGECGWCKDEVTDPRTLRRNGGGWCSGACTTTDGECAAVDAGGGH